MRRLLHLGKVALYMVVWSTMALTISSALLLLLNVAGALLAPPAPPGPAASDGGGDDIDFFFFPFLIQYKSGRVQRLMGTDTVPAATDLATGVASRDVVIAAAGLAVRLYLPTNRTSCCRWSCSTTAAGSSQSRRSRRRTMAS
jgi:hypothetical protein